MNHRASPLKRCYRFRNRKRIMKELRGNHMTLNHMTLNRPVHAVDATDGATVAAPLASGFAAYGGPAQMFTPPPPRFLLPRLAGGRS